MRPLLVSYHDIEGGAARAAYRLHTGLQQQGIDSKMLVGHKSSRDPSVMLPWPYRSTLLRKILVKLDRLPKRLYRNALPTTWSNNLLPTLSSDLLNRGEHTLVHLHWVGFGFVPITTLEKIHKPLVWTLHDMWPLTGGCHYSGECTKYTTHCGACPQLVSARDRDLSHWVWQTKQSHWQPLNFTVVTPSRWLADCARQSTLFHRQRIEVIPNGLDTTIYRPLARAEARAQLGLPQEAKLLLFGAMNSTADRRKGYHLLLPALHRLAHEQTLADLQLVVVGADRSDDAAMPPIPIHYTGYVTDEHKLAALYAAADLFVAPSLEDNLPNTVMEALACGTPSVAFRIGGVPDMIEHQGNGYLAAPFEVDDLARGMAWVLADDERHRKLAQRARARVMEEFTLRHSAAQYQALYSELLQEWADGD
ncbi:MAG: glycosyltransferase family 4 protein [Caldilineaceae bacterium]|nr:glycosyltransferase family 4 protein [Caldilineaceae bacterium]